MSGKVTFFLPYLTLPGKVVDLGKVSPIRGMVLTFPREVNYG